MEKLVAGLKESIKYVSTFGGVGSVTRMRGLPNPERGYYMA
jgi:hypothetical protein